MTLIKEPFTKYELDQEKKEKGYKIFTVRLNLWEYAHLQEDKKLLNQKKDSTAIKDLWKVGRNVLNDQKTGLIIRTLFINKKNNKRSGIVEFEEK